MRTGILRIEAVKSMEQALVANNFLSVGNFCQGI